MPSFDYIIQPGWNDSPPEHWQSHWQAVLGARRVAVADWHDPHPELWLSALEAALAAATKPVIVVAHSLGCIALAHYARRHGHGIAAALLVAPADVGRDDAPACLRRFAPVPRAPLPFPARLIASSNDPFCPGARARAMAADWQAQLTWLEGAGHINVESGHQRWEQGLSHLVELRQAAAADMRVVARRRQA
jgi:hypothetical protein